MTIAMKQSKESVKVGDDRDMKNVIKGGGLNVKKESGLFPAASEANISAEWALQRWAENN